VVGEGKGYAGDGSRRALLRRCCDPLPTPASSRCHCCCPPLDLRSSPLISSLRQGVRVFKPAARHSPGSPHQCGYSRPNFCMSTLPQKMSIKVALLSYQEKRRSHKFRRGRNNRQVWHPTYSPFLQAAANGFLQISLLLFQASGLPHQAHLLRQPLPPPLTSTARALTSQLNKADNGRFGIRPILANVHATQQLTPSKFNCSMHERVSLLTRTGGPPAFKAGQGQRPPPARQICSSQPACGQT
jgi:hypothetical protein